MKPLLIANWKMNSLLAESKERIKKLTSLLKDYQGNGELLICPSFVQIPIIAELIKDIKIANIGAQDCSAKEKGAYTGDVSAKMLKDFGCNYVIVGHAERRMGHHETDAIVQAKAQKAIEAGLTAVICVGEGKEEDNISIKVQLPNSLPQENVTADNIVIAHEPIWAIGGSITPTSEEIEHTHLIIRNILQERYGKDIANNIRILYGGSVVVSNAKEILSLENVDGVLIGGASLIAEDLTNIIKNV